MSSGLRSISGDSFEPLEAIGGWRGILEAVLPTIVFILIVALRPDALTTALLASLGLTALSVLARLAQRQSLTQALAGGALALISAVWAWRSGEASNFYATGLLINAGWLAATVLSQLLRWPLLGLFMSAWHVTVEETNAQKASEPLGAEEAPAQSSEETPLRSAWSVATAWRRDPERRDEKRRYVATTWLFAAMFAIRLGVEVPLYFGGEASLGALGVARLILGVPLYALVLWLMWLLLRPQREQSQM